MPQPAAPPPAQRRAAVKTAAEVYAATQAAGAGAAAARAPAAAGVAAGGASVVAAGIMAGFVTWLAQLREQHRRWLAGRLGQHGGRADDVAEVLRTEMLLEQEFARRSADRLAGALPQALRITDPRERERRIRQLLADEERYARQRAEAMVARAIAAVSRAALRRDSPLGAFWRLGHARNHTTGCEHPDAALRVRGLLAIGRRRYVGVLVKAATARGRVVAVTPNHPVLTSRGWLPAHALNEGDYLFDASGLQSGAGRYQDFDDGPTSAQEIFDALAARGDLGITELPVGSEDFHGDGQHGYVEVVGANGALLDGLISGRSQRVGERLLMPTDATLAQLASEGRSTSSGVAVDALFADGAQSYATALKPQRDGCAAHARVTGEGEHRLASLISPDQLRRSSGNALGVLLRDRHAEAFKSADDGMRTPESVVPRQAGASLASLIAPDEIVRIRRVPYSGHVYSLSTEPGWYMSEQRVVHNCLHMAGKFWPWVVLDRVAPPRHYGCTSSLHSYAEAVLKGWMGPEDVPDPRAAVRAASGVVMEAAEADALLAELDVRDQLREQGVDTSAIAFAGLRERSVAAEPRDPRGRWVRSAAALLKAGKPAEIESRDAPALIDELASETQPSSLHLLQIKGHPNLFRAHARELSRGEMPQIPKAHLPGFMDYLAARRVTARVQSVHPSSLQATQNQINGGAAALIAKVGNVKGLMMVSRDGHVLDGHHRWGAAALLGANDPNARVDVLRFSVGTDRILRLMREYNELAGVQARVFGEGRVAK